MNTLSSFFKPQVRSHAFLSLSMVFWALVTALVRKNFRLILFRQPLKCSYVAFILPVALCALFCIVTDFVFPSGTFGISLPHPVKTLGEALEIAKPTGRNKLVLVNNDHGGYGELVLGSLGKLVASEHPSTSIVRVLNSSEIKNECVSNVKGATSCFAAIIMHPSPNPISDGIWNYTISTDAAFASSPLVFNTAKDTNPEQVYILPLKRAMDRIIAKITSSDPLTESLDNMAEIAFTSATQAQREAEATRFHYRAITNSLGVAFLTSILWITYHLAGFVATEKETCMSLLIDSMARVNQPWKAAIARMTANHISFSAIYAPGWIVCGIIMHFMVYEKTNLAILVTLQLLSGLAMASLAIFFASLFKRAQLSGATAILATLVLGILTQVTWKVGTGIILPLSILFPPCGYVHFVVLMARFELRRLPTNLLSAPPDTWGYVTASTFLIIFFVQIFIYPTAALIISNGFNFFSPFAPSQAENTMNTHQPSQHAVQLRNITKVYKKSFFARCFQRGLPASPAINDISMEIDRGQIVALLGANGSGKTTTLQAIAGWSRLSSGLIKIDRTGGFGIAPQKNILWDALTVEQHIRIFCELKAEQRSNHDSEVQHLIKAIGLSAKMSCTSKDLSGGQKRRLQLGMMLAGGSAVCCVDEVSSGVDPIARRKLWNILLAERGTRTIILTTHFLEEADVLADHVAILAQGSIRAEGSSLELKERHGGGFAIVAELRDKSDILLLPSVPGTSHIANEKDGLSVTYTMSSTKPAAEVIVALEQHGITNYRLNAPSLETAFMKITQDIQNRSLEDTADGFTEASSSGLPTESLAYSQQPRGQLELTDGEAIDSTDQIRILRSKRWTLFRRNMFPYLLAVAIPIFAGGLTLLYVRDKQYPKGCLPSEQTLDHLQTSYVKKAAETNLLVAAGPPSKLAWANITNLVAPMFPSLYTHSNPSTSAGFASALAQLEIMNTYDAFSQFVTDNRENLTTALWLGDDQHIVPTTAWVANRFIISALTAQGVMASILANTSIATSWSPLGTVTQPGLDGTLSLIIYMAIALIAFPALFALYPTQERLSAVRERQYSCGVQPSSLWFAYLSFDFTCAMVGISVATLLWAALSTFWYSLTCYFVVLILYTIASILLSYLVSLFAKTQLAAFAWTAGTQGVVFCVYVLTFLLATTYGDAPNVNSNILILHFTFSILAPIGSVMRALFLTTNFFSTACAGNDLSRQPASLEKYGGPIVYLVVQSAVLLMAIIFIESRRTGTLTRPLAIQRLAKWLKSISAQERTDSTTVAAETTLSINEGLKISNLSKSFGSVQALQDISFHVKRGEIFALLGPNGAGKSTTMSLIQGDIKPSNTEGAIYIDKMLVSDGPGGRHRLGVCTQFDTLERMTVRQHLELYAKIRGVKNVAQNVSNSLKSFGLENKAKCLAETLSGGNKRKLSLAIALIGNPSVLLLDEPSSSLDANAKRMMWRTLSLIVQGRAILFTTHSMEEAEAIANRVGILSTQLLASGTQQQLSKRFDDEIYVHIVAETAPYTSFEDMQGVLGWIGATFGRAKIEMKPVRGQVRFSVKRRDVLSLAASGRKCTSAVGRLFLLLEENKANLGIRHFDINSATLNQVFLSIVGDPEQPEEQETATNCDV